MSAIADNSAVAAERKASSFSNVSKQIKGNKRIKPLTRDFFTLLIKLEADFNNKQYTVETLDELIQYYAKAVEYYDSIKDEISSYFIFKIQDILATKKSLKMLLEQNKAGSRAAGANLEAEANDAKANKKVTFEEKTPKDKDIKGNIVEESSGEEDEEDKRVTAIEKMRRAAKKIERKNRISISTMKNEKQRFVNFFYKMETQKVSEKQTMKTIINDFAATSDKNDIFAKKDMDSQKERLRKRLEKRKAEIMSHTMNTISYHVGGTTYDESNERKTTENYGSFLDELDGIEGSGSKQLSNITGSERLDTEGDGTDFFKPATEDNESKNNGAPFKFLAPPGKIETPSFDNHEHPHKISPKGFPGFGKLNISPKNINNPEAIKKARMAQGMPNKSE